MEVNGIGKMVFVTLDMLKSNVIIVEIVLAVFRDDCCAFTILSFFCLAGKYVMCEQTVSCEGCGTIWVIICVGNQVLARIVECPLCSIEKVS